MRLAHVDEHGHLLLVHQPLQFNWSNLGNAHVDLLLLAAYSAELLIVDQFRDGWTFTADRALGILAQFQLPELHAERIKQQQASDKRLAFAGNELHGFERLQATDNAWQHT